ncbi:MAG TPA: serine/threonine-protein kinase [Kofleriaceae bacterium]|nr:serine/threonine-protein kinase [Kofleriaceae bacterium]
MTAGRPEREPTAHRPIADRYWPVRLLAVGGMAEIYLARQSGAGSGGAGNLLDASFDKELVIKRLKPVLAADPAMLDMFLDEARVSALFHNPHVVQVFDVGEEDRVPFIVMEYIRGEELNELCRRGLAAGAFLPLEHAVELVRQAAMALGYVHALRDADGRGLDVVHCDVSPTNLLVTEDGYLKVIDFGITRSRGQRRRDEHVVPGKLSYMSPEQARREPLDHRSDIFSLGVVLYEIALGRRLFKGPAQEVVKRLARCDVKPPTFVQRDFPGMLESVIMRALEARPADRYASAYDMADDLEEFLRESGLRSDPLRVARYLDELAVAVGGERRPELVSEREERDDDALDFDRGIFEGYRASPESAARVADWDEVEENEQAVADALGVDVRLVKSASAALAEEWARAAGQAPQPPPRARPLEPEDRSDTEPMRVRPPDIHRAPTEPPRPPPDSGPPPPVIGTPPGLPRALVFGIGLAAGVVVVLLLRLLFS